MKKHFHSTSLLMVLVLVAAMLICCTPAAEAAVIGNARLISADVVEIDCDTNLGKELAEQSITIVYDGQEVEWEYLSYFDFGPYAERGGVINVRLKNALDVGEPRIQRREVTLFEDSQTEKGAAAAAKLKVNGWSATWKPFFSEIQRGHMSSLDVWGSAASGNVESTSANGKWSANDVAFGTTVDDTTRKYTTDYITKVVGEGINGMVGRSEYLNLPMMEAGLTVHVVGDEQSVYEDPAYRDLYVAGETTDTYTRDNIAGSFEKPIIVTTADEVMRHDSADGARVNDDFFQLGYDFLKMYYQYGVVEGSLCFPVGYNTDADEYRYDKQLEAAWEAAKAEGKWAGTVMMDSLENYYIYGALIHFEMIPESADGTWQRDRFPVNTREELAEYDEGLYRVLAGIHGRYHWFTGNNSQSITTNDFMNDVLKNAHPWFWMSQVDNYDVNGERPALGIEHVDIIADNQIEIKFDREIKNITAAADLDNWKVYIDGQPVEGTYEAEGWVWGANGWEWGKYQSDRVYLDGGYVWRTITLYVEPETANGTLVNDKPYGRDFSGFTQADLDERSVSNGGWISDDEQPGENALELGQMVTLEDAIANGAGAIGKVEVEYVGTEPIVDWAGNELAAGTKVEANFNPWVGTAFRSALTGVYIYADSVASTESIEAAGHLYDSELANNTTKHYEQTAGGDDLPTFEQMDAAAAAPNNSSDRNAVAELKASSILTEGVTYDNPGQRIADGSVKRGGGMQLIAGYTYGHHAAMQPTHRNQICNGFHVWLYVEGWGGTTFQSDETMIQKDAQMTRYKNENLVYHEGGHGLDSFTRNADTYGQNLWADITAAWITAISYENGRTWWNQYNTEGAYLRNRDEYTSTGSTFYNSTMREQFMGVNDGTWTPINTREELYRYDPYAFEVFKRMFYNGDLGLWYADENGVIQTGNPEYRVIPSDWEILRDTYDEFSHWTSEDDLIAWACTIAPTANYDPYTGETHELINWISWSTPNVWDITTNDNPAVATNTKDFVGGVAYNANDANGNNTINQDHPFFANGGVQKPVRPAEVEALVAPVTGNAGEVTRTHRPVVVEFDITDYSGEVTMDNAPTTFELYVNDELTHFYFWNFEENEDGSATVQLRVEWPIAGDADLRVEMASTEAPLNPVVTGVKADPASMEAEGGYSTITLTGTELSNGIKVALYDGDKTVSSSATTGDATSQSVKLTVPANNTEETKSYVVKYSLDGGETWTGTTVITVAGEADEPVIPVDPAVVDEASIDADRLTSIGGEVTATLTGSNLVNGIQIAAFDDDEIIAIATTTGDDAEQTATLDIPLNNSSSYKKYDVMYSLDGGKTWTEIDSVKIAAGTTDSKPIGGKPDKGDASLSINSADINLADSVEDLVIVLDLEGRKLKGLKNGNDKLDEGTEYTVDGNTVTIKGSYLAGLAEGTYSLTFDMSGGKDPILALNVTKKKVEYTVMQPTRPAGAKVDAVKTKNPLMLNGVQKDFPAVNIDGYNWLKLRDVAMLLLGTQKGFSIDYDAEAKIIDITTGGVYAPLGDELQDKLSDVSTAVASPQQLRLDGKVIDIAAYNIDGYNYFRLRDIAILLDFGVDFAEDTRIVTLNLADPYKE